MSDNSPKYTLGETVDGYLLRTGNYRRKHFAQYFQMAQDVYKDLYRTIMPSTISKYVQVFPAGVGDKYPFVLKPENMDRFIGASITNNNNELIDIVYNEDLNVFTKPQVEKSCGCVTTELCDCIDNLEVVITEKMVVGNIPRYEKVWIKCCSNGDVLQYSETPVVDDPINFPDRVEVIKSYKNLGRLETKDCGCPLETEANTNLIYNKCGCHLGLKPKCCKIWYNKSGIDCTGEMKFSECGNKLYFKNVRDDAGFAVIHFQPTIGCEEIMIDDAAREPIRFGMDYESSVFNPKVNAREKREKERLYQKSKTKFWEWLHPLNEKRFFTIPTSWISW